MAKVVLENVKKIYPHPNLTIKGKQKRDKANQEQGPHLQVVENGVVAVQQFNLTIEDKEFVVLVGPSGCGKSTTLRMIAGLESVTEGNIYIGDRCVNSVEPKDRDIAMVFQNYALYPHMTVYENMAFSLKIRKTAKNEIDARVREAAEILGITDLLNRKPKALSGGQRQRVAIGRAIVREPKVFLMDEPLSNLDAKLRNQMRAEIIKLHNRVNTTFIYVTHDQTEAMTLADKIVIMRDGFVQQIGSPQEVFAHPANLFVAGFIGIPQMNFFDAELALIDEKYYIAFQGNKKELPIIMQQCLRKKEQASCPIILGIRPEHISFSEKGEISGTLDVTELMGSEMHLHVKIGGTNAIIRIPTPEHPETLYELSREKEKLHFTYDATQVHLFDFETKDSLFL